jgi:enoyl-CoA hydratase/carnithine racemase
MTYETLAVEREGGVARVWLARPERLNALNARALEDIAAVFTELRTAFDVQAIVLGGRGPSFSAGADRKDPPARFARGSGAGPRERRHAALLGRRAVEAIERSEAVTIARLHGHVIGGAVLLALACDLRVAAEDASFQIPEVDIGIPLTWGGVPRLVAAVGAARARELVLLCDRFDAVAAERWGVVNRVVPAANLDATVADWAHRLAAKPPWAVHMTKSQFRAYARTVPLGDATEMDGDLLTLASEEDPTRFLWPGKRETPR